MSLSKKWLAFIDEWFINGFNGTEAYMTVYKPKSRGTARANAAKLLANTSIQDEIQSRFAEKQMSADEALTLLTDMARGDLGDFMDISSVGFNLDLLNEDGTRKNTKLIRKIKQKTTTFIAKKESEEDREVTETEIELYDAQSAIDKILRVHGRYKDVGTEFNPLVLKGYKDVSPDDWDDDKGK